MLRHSKHSEIFFSNLLTLHAPKLVEESALVHLIQKTPIDELLRIDRLGARLGARHIVSRQRILADHI